MMMMMMVILLFVWSGTAAAEAEIGYLNVLLCNRNALVDEK